jgi:hypothetical protein
VNIYPNPAREQFTVELDKPSNIKVINALGQTVINIDVDGKSIINTSTLPAGIYIIRVEGYKATSLVIQR